MHPTKKLGLIALVTSFFATPYATLAAYTGPTGLGESASSAGLDTSPGQLPVIIGTVIKAALGLVGVIFLVLMVYAGYIWMIARGDESKTSKAKDTITAAIIGVVIVIGAYALTTYIVDAMTGASGSGTGASVETVSCTSNTDCAGNATKKTCGGLSASVQVGTCQ